jgi:hypothetical protein
VDLVPMGLAMTTATYLITADQVRMVPTAVTVTTLFRMMLVPAMPTTVVQTHATAFVTQSGASGARARPAEGSWPWGSALPAQTTMATILDSRPTCKFRAPRLLLFLRYGV